VQKIECGKKKERHVREKKIELSGFGDAHVQYSGQA
jgi:hypothetical protein